MTDDGGALVPVVVHQCREVAGHSALVVTRVRLLGLAVTAQIGSDDGVPLCEHRYLSAPCEPSLWKAVQEINRRTVSSTDPGLNDPVEASGVVCDSRRYGHDSLPLLGWERSGICSRRLPVART